MTAYVALGSNLGPRREILRRAVSLLEADPAVRVTGRSRLVDSPPMGPDQPGFVNGVVRLETDLSPEALLGLLQRVERLLGRRPHGRRWGPRIVDLDLLLYGTRQIRTRRLTVPHPGLARPFVAGPLAELAPPRAEGTP